MGVFVLSPCSSAQAILQAKEPEKENSMGISKFYHLTMKAMEDAKWQRLFEDGAEVELGRTYSAVRHRTGVIKGPFAALAYEAGVLLIGNPEINRYCVIHTDVADIKGELVTDKVRGGVFSIKKDLAEMPAFEEDAVLWIQNASRVKWFFALTEPEARLFLKWLRKK